MPFRAIATTLRSVRNAALAAIAVLALGVPNAEAQSVSATLQDLPQDEGTRLAIKRMADQGIMVPRSAGKFAPQSPTSLGEYLASVQHMFSLPPVKHPTLFTDVPESSPYYSAVQATSP